MHAFYAAEAGLEQAAASLQCTYDSTGAPPLVMPIGTNAVNNCAVVYSTTDDGFPTVKDLTVGSMAGLHALMKSFSLNSTATSLQDHGKVEMSQTFETALIPIFQFAVFYGNDLEIAPGPDMTLFGRVHINGNLYLQSNNNLRMDSYVTALGNIIHGRKGAGAAGASDVLAKNATGTYVSMKDGSDLALPFHCSPPRRMPDCLFVSGRDARHHLLILRPVCPAPRMKTNMR